MILSQNIRVIQKDNTVYNDLSLQLVDKPETSAFPAVSSEDALYIGQLMPFNSIYIEPGVVNATTSSMVIEYWSGQEWRTVVDQLDGTNLSGATLGQAGVIQFQPNRDFEWDVVDEPSKEPGFDLSGVAEIYDQYWLKITFSVDLDLTTTLRRFGWKFCTDNQLKDVYRRIDDYKSSFETGKTDWTDEILLAGRHTINELRVKGLILEPGQIIDLENVSYATAYQAVMLIFEQLGGGFVEDHSLISDRFSSLMNRKRFTIDLDQNADREPHDVNQSSVSFSTGVR